MREAVIITGAGILSYVNWKEITFIRSFVIFWIRRN